VTGEIIKELVERIYQELEEIPRVTARMNEGWDRARRSNDDYYLDGVALNLHGFYMGIERILTRIAETIDGSLPRGENWHLLLLEQMMKEVPGIRPAVISNATGTKLDEYRKFRHIVRNVYTHNFDPVKLGKLVNSAPDLFTQAKAELLAFTAFLEQ
jgi:hypothetical protein